MPEGARLGHFELLEQIGEGGMGRVYRAKDTRLNRFVAIKLLPEARLTDSGRRARFVQEAKAASALNHPNIITIHEIGEHEGQTFIVMELVQGKPLSELIPRNGMRLIEALRIATQVADALAAAHAADIVHRDLKPGNIMVDANGRVKVLDFGLAKLVAPVAAGPDERTRTVAMDVPLTEEGAIVGSIPYMSPEQAEGKPLDSRSDIFSFGSVLYEMIAGQRAFQGNSRASTLAAVVERDPPPVSEISSSTPPELDRVIARCLRKDVQRRSQSMADVKLALEELRDESESGKLARTATASAPVRARRWLWPAIAGASVLIAVAAIAWTYASHRGAASLRAPELIRLSPDDGHSYSHPAISADGKFVAYSSNRTGSREIWLQQVGGGDPIQLTHSAEQAGYPTFFPDGTRILYRTVSPDFQKTTIEVIPTLGGQPRVLLQTGRMYGPALSPDGHQISWIDVSGPSERMMLMPAEGGTPRELSSWSLTQGRSMLKGGTWTSDSRYVLCIGTKRRDATNYDEWEWYALPVDGGDPVATGAGHALRKAGFSITVPEVMIGDRVLFGMGKGEVHNIWEVRLSDSWRVRGTPRQLTFGTLDADPERASATGTVPVDVTKSSADFYLLPLDATTGQPSGPVRRLTQDGRNKSRTTIGGNPAIAYFSVHISGSRPPSDTVFALDLKSGSQTLVLPSVPWDMGTTIAPDGRQIAYSVAEGNSYSIRLGEAGAGPDSARVVCKGCGFASRFSPDGRYLLYYSGATVRPDPKKKQSVNLLELASGQQRLLLEHPSDSIISIGFIGEDNNWLAFGLSAPGPQRVRARYIAPWRETPIPESEWIEFHPPAGIVNFNFAAAGNYFTFFLNGKLMAMRFDPKRRSVGEPYELKPPAGSAAFPTSYEATWIRGPGLVFARQEQISSVWLMKLPRE